MDEYDAAGDMDEDSDGEDVSQTVDTLTPEEEGQGEEELDTSNLNWQVNAAEIPALEWSPFQEHGQLKTSVSPTYAATLPVYVELGLQGGVADPAEAYRAHRHQHYWTPAEEELYCEAFGRHGTDFADLARMLRKEMIRREFGGNGDWRKVVAAADDDADLLLGRRRTKAAAAASTATPEETLPVPSTWREKTVSECVAYYYMHKEKPDCPFDRPRTIGTRGRAASAAWAQDKEEGAAYVPTSYTRRRGAAAAKPGKGRWTSKPTATSTTSAEDSTVNHATAAAAYAYWPGYAGVDPYSGYYYRAAYAGYQQHYAAMYASAVAASAASTTTGAGTPTPKDVMNEMISRLRPGKGGTAAYPYMHPYMQRLDPRFDPRYYYPQPYGGVGGEYDPVGPSGIPMIVPKDTTPEDVLRQAGPAQEHKSRPSVTAAGRQRSRRAAAMEECMSREAAFALQETDTMDGAYPVTRSRAKRRDPEMDTSTEAAAVAPRKRAGRKSRLTKGTDAPKRQLSVHLPDEDTEMSAAVPSMWDPDTFSRLQSAYEKSTSVTAMAAMCGASEEECAQFVTFLTSHYREDGSSLKDSVTPDDSPLSEASPVDERELGEDDEEQPHPKRRRTDNDGWVEAGSEADTDAHDPPVSTPDEGAARSETSSPSLEASPDDDSGEYGSAAVARRGRKSGRGGRKRGTGRSVYSASTGPIVALPLPDVPLPIRAGTGWSDAERDMYVRVLQHYGRCWTTMKEFIPGKTLPQLKTYYQNYKTKLGLERILHHFEEHQRLSPADVTPAPARRTHGDNQQTFQVEDATGTHDILDAHKGERPTVSTGNAAYYSSLQHAQMPSTYPSEGSAYGPPAYQQPASTSTPTYSGSYGGNLASSYDQHAGYGNYRYYLGAENAASTHHDSYHAQTTSSTPAQHIAPLKGYAYPAMTGAHQTNAGERHSAYTSAHDHSYHQSSYGQPLYRSHPSAQTYHQHPHQRDMYQGQQTTHSYYQGGPDDHYGAISDHHRGVRTSVAQAQPVYPSSDWKTQDGRSMYGSADRTGAGPPPASYSEPQTTSSANPSIDMTLIHGQLPSAFADGTQM